MPYIKIEDRLKYNQVLTEIKQIIHNISEDKLAGELNYLITEITHITTENANYRRFNKVIGVMESAKLELYRRKIAPYEDKKISENGDV